MIHDGKNLGDISFEVTDDALFKEKVVSKGNYGSYMVETNEILTKEAFIECYRKWIEGVEK